MRREKEEEQTLDRIEPQGPPQRGSLCSHKWPMERRGGGAYGREQCPRELFGEQAYGRRAQAALDMGLPKVSTAVQTPMARDQPTPDSHSETEHAAYGKVVCSGKCRGS